MEPNKVNLDEIIDKLGAKIAQLEIQNAALLTVVEGFVGQTSEQEEE